MELRALRYIVALAQELNFTRAADRLGITQSALSRSIREFEERCNVRLFDRARGGGGVFVTSVGREVAAAAKAILNQEKDLYSLVERIGRGESGHVAFGVGHLPGRSILPNVLVKVLAERPGTTINVAVDQFKPLLSLLEAERIEFFVCGPGAEVGAGELNQELIGDHPFGLNFFVRPGHPLLSLSERPNDTNTRDVKYPIITAAAQFEFSIPEPLVDHIDPAPRIRSSDLAALSVVAQFSDAILLSFGATTRAEVLGAKLVELRPEPLGRLSFPMILYSLRGRGLSPFSQWIISLLHYELGRIAKI